MEFTFWQAMYDLGVVTEQQLQAAVTKKYITQAQYNQIVSPKSANTPNG